MRPIVVAAVEGAVAAMGAAMVEDMAGIVARVTTDLATTAMIVAGVIPPAAQMTGQRIARKKMTDHLRVLNPEEEASSVEFLASHPLP